MGIIAITPIQFGKEDGTVDYINVGDSITGLPDDLQRDLVLNGSAVETGSKRKYTSIVGSSGPVDSDTVKRDALIAKALSGMEDDSTAPGIPATAAGAGANVPGGPPATQGNPLISEAASPVSQGAPSTDGPAGRGTTPVSETSLPR